MLDLLWSTSPIATVGQSSYGVGILSYGSPKACDEHDCRSPKAWFTGVVDYKAGSNDDITISASFKNFKYYFTFKTVTYLS